MAAKQKQVMEMRPQLQIIEATVENPLFSRAHTADKLGNTRFVKAHRNVRESGISVLVSKGALDEAQAWAADEFRRLFEAMGASGARGIDMTKEFVDGGRFPDPIGQHAIDAGKKLAKAHECLTARYGIYGWKIVGYVCGEGRNIHDLTHTRRQRDTMTDNLRDYLDCLAEHWSVKTKR